MAYVQIAILGPEPDPVLRGVRELGATHLTLVGVPGSTKAFERVKGAVEPLGVPTDHVEVEGEMLVGTIRAVQAVADQARARREHVLLNLGGADRRMACAGLSAAFVAGIKSFDVMDDRIVFLPVLEFSYREVVSDAKLAILRALRSLGGSCDRLKTLASEADVSDSLVSYHIRGGRDARGLQDLGLVTVDRGARGALTIALTPMGELLAAGMRDATARSGRGRAQ